MLIIVRLPVSVDGSYWLRLTWYNYIVYNYYYTDLIGYSNSGVASNEALSACASPQSLKLLVIFFLDKFCTSASDRIYAVFFHTINIFHMFVLLLFRLPTVLMIILIFYGCIHKRSRNTAVGSLSIKDRYTWTASQMKVLHGHEDYHCEMMEYLQDLKKDGSKCLISTILPRGKN